MYVVHVLYNYITCIFCILIKWSLFIVDTSGTQLTVLIREVSLFQRWICTQLYVVGTADTDLIREVSLIWSVERFHCIQFMQSPI